MLEYFVKSFGSYLHQTFFEYLCEIHCIAKTNKQKDNFKNNNVTMNKLWALTRGQALS